MHSSRMWFLAIVAVAICTDVVTGNDDGKVGAKVGVQPEQQQQQQQQRTASDVMQAIAAGSGGGNGRQLTGWTPSADCYFCADRPVGQIGYPAAKRAHKQYGFGLGKRLYRQYEFGLGKRSASKQYGFGLGKRAALKQYEFGLGKRVPPTYYNFGLGRRASPQYSFGLGKRVSHSSVLSVDDRDADYTYNDLSEEKKRTSADGMGHGQRFAFGLGKRGGMGAEWDDGGDDDDDGAAAAAAAPIIWHPAVRRARLQYGFGLGKRLANDDDYDVDDAETAAQFQDDGADNN